MTVTHPVLRYHGAKFRMAHWVMQFFPAHRIYVEPFGGAAGVLIQKQRAYSEVYNDIDGDMVNFFRIVRDEATRKTLTEQLVLTPYAREEFEQAWLPADEPIERARRLVVRAMMGFGSAGATKGTTGFRIDSKRQYETAQHTWAMYPNNLAAVGNRLAGVLIENRPAIEVMLAHDTDQTLHYADPPYVHSTRCRINGKDSARGYRHEMNNDDHAELLECVRGLKGMVVLSGYATELYDAALPDWRKHSVKARISGGRGTEIRTENIWLNPACVDSIEANRGQLELMA